MSAFKKRFVFAAGVVLLVLFWAIAVGPEPPARISISPEELVRAVTIQRDSLIDLCLIEHVDPNGRDAQGRTPLLIATSQQDWKTARRLVDAGAKVDLADKKDLRRLWRQRCTVIWKSFSCSWRVQSIFMPKFRRRTGRISWDWRSMAVIRRLLRP